MTILSTKEQLAITSMTNEEIKKLAQVAKKEARLAGVLAASSVAAIIISPPLAIGFSIAASLGFGASLESVARARELQDILRERGALEDPATSGAEPLSATSLAERSRVVREKLSAENPQNTPKP